VAVVESKKTLINNVLSAAISPLFEPIAPKEIDQLLGKQFFGAQKKQKENGEEEIIWAEARRDNVKISLKKLTQIAKTVRGLNYTEAIGQLTFQHFKVAPIIIGLLKQAKSNGENLYGWDPSRLIVGKCLISPSCLVFSPFRPSFGTLFFCCLTSSYSLYFLSLSFL
jgi:hypothetical protein